MMKLKNTVGTIAIVALSFVGAGCLPMERKAPVGGDNAEISKEVAAERLDLSGKQLEKVPMSVFGQTELVELDLSNNLLTGALPAEIRKLKNLRVLRAGQNMMTGLPAEVGQLPNLTELDLSDNKLTGLPLELGNLANLRRLDLRGNDVTKQDLDVIRAKLLNTEILE